eukprot:1499389-Pleurochrysis_carterae.AAC.5
MPLVGGAGLNGTAYGDPIDLRFQNFDEAQAASRIDHEVQCQSAVAAPDYYVFMRASASPQLQPQTIVASLLSLWMLAAYTVSQLKYHDVKCFRTSFTLKDALHAATVRFAYGIVRWDSQAQISTLPARTSLKTAEQLDFCGSRSRLVPRDRGNLTHARGWPKIIST